MRQSSGRNGLRLGGKGWLLAGGVLTGALAAAFSPGSAEHPAFDRLPVQSAPARNEPAKGWNTGGTDPHAHRVRTWTC